MFLAFAAVKKKSCRLKVPVCSCKCALFSDIFYLSVVMLEFRRRPKTKVEGEEGGGRVFTDGQAECGQPAGGLRGASLCALA